MKSIYSITVVLLSATRAWAATTTEPSAATGTEATGVEEPSAAPTLNAPSVHGCFSSSGPLVFNSTQTFNSKGKCATDICFAMGKPVGGTTSGSDCWCGDKYPPKDTLSSDSNCNIGCTGYPLQACGGTEFWTIYNTGLVLGVEYASDDSSSPGASASSSAGVARPTPTEPAVVTISGSTVVVTATNPADKEAPAASNPNPGAIAAGVVVGVVVVASIVGSVIFLLRRRRNKELEDEHRHNAAVNAFMNGGKPPGSSGGNSITDARLDPVMTQRRLSDGSIADNQDYSRRILRVTNA